MNILKLPVVGPLIRSRAFPLAVQVLFLAAFVFLAAGGFGVTAPDAATLKELRNTNLANLLVWSLWFPMVVMAAVLFGRAWCAVCPLELVTAVAGRTGLKRRIPAFLKSGWVMTGFYAAIVIVGIHTLAIHRVPHHMALYLAVLFGLALAVSLVYEKRAFCSHVCPVGHLLGLYAQCAPLEWGADDAQVCRGCRTKDCVARGNRDRLIGRSCASDLYPATIRDNRHCLLCTQCQKACPHDNLRFSWRRPFLDFLKPFPLRPAQIAFVLVVGGFVVYEILSEWSVSKKELMWLPEAAAGALGWTGGAASFLGATILFLLLPGAVLLLAAGASRALGAASIRDAAGALALLALPTAAGMHLLKGLLKVTSRIPYWSPAVGDPEGSRTASAIVGKSLALDATVPQALGPVLSGAGAVILAVAFAAMLAIAVRAPAVRRLPAAARIPVLLAAAAYWGLFAVTIVRWRFLA